MRYLFCTLRVINVLRRTALNVALSVTISTVQPPDETSSIDTDTINLMQYCAKSVPLSKPPPVVSDKRYNAVLHGIDESPTHTPRSDHQKHDLDKLLNILSSIDTSLTTASIQDFHRLGKYKPTNTRPHPVLVKFLRTFEASLVLSKKDSLTSSSQISIKCDMSFEEDTIENALLKERCSLIDSGIKCKFIKIHGNSLYIKNKLYMAWYRSPNSN